MVKQHKCPLCHKLLTLKQVNFNLAVYMCDDMNCQYPVGCECIIIERKLEDIDKYVEEINEVDNSDLNSWADNIAKTNHTKTQPENLDFNEIIGETWINKNAAPTTQTFVETGNQTQGCNNADLDDILNFFDNIS